MIENEIEAAFIKWWQESYGRPPGSHAVMTHVSFAAHLVELIKLDEDTSAKSV